MIAFTNCVRTARLTLTNIFVKSINLNCQMHAIDKLLSFQHVVTETTVESYVQTPFAGSIEISDQCSLPCDLQRKASFQE